MKVFFKAQTTCKFIDVYMHFRPVDALRVEEKGKSTLQSVQLSDSEIKLERLMAVSSWPATQDTYPSRLKRRQLRIPYHPSR